MMFTILQYHDGTIPLPEYVMAMRRVEHESETNIITDR
jgi:hypothetical protein